MTVQPMHPVPWERSGVIAPGLPILPHGVERYPVPGGGSRAVQVCKGDAIIVQDREGLQPGELVHFAPDGSSDASMLGTKGQGRPTATIAVLSEGGPSGKKVLSALDAAGFNLETGDSVAVFEEGSRPGDFREFNAERDGLLICVAPGGPMSPERQDTPTELVLYVRRVAPGDGKDEIGPPDPLAEPRFDANIQPGNSVTYEVRKGEYIQILDVKGRECSDFQAFSLRALDKGIEREIDPTTTRSLMGSLYPSPGIFSKYWTVDQEPWLRSFRTHAGDTTRSALPVRRATTRTWAIPGMSIVRTT